MTLEGSVHKHDGARVGIVVVLKIVLVTDVADIIITVVVVIVVKGMDVHGFRVVLLVTIGIVNELLPVTEVLQEVVGTHEEVLHTIHTEPAETDKHLEQGSSKNDQGKVQLSSINIEHDDLNVEEREIADSDDRRQSSGLILKLLHLPSLKCVRGVIAVRRTITPGEIPAAREGVGREETDDHGKHDVVGDHRANHKEDGSSPIGNDGDNHREHKNDDHNPYRNCICPVGVPKIDMPQCTRINQRVVFHHINYKAGHTGNGKDC